MLAFGHMKFCVRRRHYSQFCSATKEVKGSLLISLTGAEVLLVWVIS